MKQQAIQMSHYQSKQKRSISHVVLDEVIVEEEEVLRGLDLRFKEGISVKIGVRLVDQVIVQLVDQVEVIH